jgi:hypothetical protein
MVWLRQIHGGFEHVRRLYLYGFNPTSPSIAHCGILQRCTNLEAVILQGRPSRLLFVSFASVYQHEEDAQTEVIPLRTESLGMFRNLCALRSLEWRTFQDGTLRGQLQALQFKLLLGSGTEVVWTQSTRHFTEISEVSYEKDAIAWAHRMLEAEDFGFVKNFKVP